MDESSRLIPVEADRVKILGELTQDEQRDRHRLELKVEQAFYQAGKALAQLRQQRLYRSTHKTFEAYCQDKFRFTRRYSDYLIAASVVENLQQIRTIHSQNYLDEEHQFNENSRTVQDQILPTRLEQIKPLASLKPDAQRQVWDKAVETANGKVPSGRIVKEIVKQLKEKPPLLLAQDDWQVSDILVVQRSLERLAIAGVPFETEVASRGHFMRRLSSPTQSKSHGNTPVISSTARPTASMGTTKRPTAPARQSLNPRRHFAIGKCCPGEMAYLSHRDCQARAHLKR